MSARARLGSRLVGSGLGLLAFGALTLGALGCKPESSAVAGTPAQDPPAAPAKADPAPEAIPAGADEGATLAAVSGGPGASPTEPDALDPQEAQPADAPAAEVAKAEPEPAALPAEPYKVLILGDSLAATGFGALLERKLDAHPHVVAFREGKSASGLARPDFFDWLEMGKKHAEFRQPDLVIVIMGGNDGDRKSVV